METDGDRPYNLDDFVPGARAAATVALAGAGTLLAAATAPRALAARSSSQQQVHALS